MGGIASVAVVTKNRAASLGATLESYAENRRQFARRHDFVIADGSHGVSEQAKYRRLLGHLKVLHGIPISYAGEWEKHLFLKALVRQGISRRVAEFALFGCENAGPDFGANRNAVLLHTAGDMIFCPDDDVWCRSAAPPGSRETTLVFGSTANPEEWRFFRTRAAALELVRHKDEDALSPHERFLGNKLPSPRRNRVIATLNGLLGDCALSTPHLYFRLEGASRRRLCRSRSSWKSALSRQVLRAAPRPTAAMGTSFTTSAVALDNRGLLPPFAPLFRNEDGLFGLALKKCLPDCCFVHIPRALVHMPPKARTFSPKDFWNVFHGNRVNDFLCHCLSSFEPKGASAEENLRALGRHLIGISSRKDFRERVRNEARRAQALQLLHLSDLLEAHDRTPAFWALDLERYRRNLEKALTRGEPAPFGRECRSAEAWTKFQRFALDYGWLLEAWPDIIRASTCLRERGIRLARPI